MRPSNVDIFRIINTTQVNIVPNGCRAGRKNKTIMKHMAKFKLFGEFILKYKNKTNGKAKSIFCVGRNK